MKLSRFKREIAAAAAYAALLLNVLVFAPSFYSSGNLRDLMINNIATLLVALGMTLVVLAGEIDISVGSQFAVCSVIAGELARAGMPMVVLVIAIIFVGVLMGALNGALIGFLRLPSIIVTLAMLVAWRDLLRLVTAGAWIQDLPNNFQWFGLGQTFGEVLLVVVSVGLLIFFPWALRNLSVGRSI
jgi:rhamnose transport system permease protein